LAPGRHRPESSREPIRVRRVRERPQLHGPAIRSRNGQSGAGGRMLCSFACWCSRHLGRSSAPHRHQLR
jgi:hypothetical protein